MDPHPPELLATYNECIPYVTKRTFELSADRVRVYGTQNGTQFDSVVIVTDLRKEPNRLWVRTVHYRTSTWTLMILTPILTVICVLFPEEIHLLIAVYLFVSALAYFGWSLRKFEFAQFIGPGGIAVLDIARSGPDEKMFDEFTAKISQAITDHQNRGSA